MWKLMCTFLIKHSKSNIQFNKGSLQESLIIYVTFSSSYGACNCKSCVTLKWTIVFPSFSY